MNVTVGHLYPDYLNIYADRDPLEAAERGGEGLEAGDDLRERYAELPGKGPCRDRVVDVVEAGEAEADGGGALGRLEREARAVEAVEFDLACGDVERRAP